MLYPNLKFPKISGPPAGRAGRPFFYTNFVQTLDGKVHVRKSGYWPIGSRVDHGVLMELRAYADCLIHGGNLAREFGEVTVKNLARPQFKNLRKKLGKEQTLPYYIISKKRTGVNPSTFRYGAGVIHLEGDLGSHLLPLLMKKGYKHVLVEGGPTLLGSFLKENLIDEIFITIAPKIFGTEANFTLTLVEGILFPKKATKKLKLLSIKQIGDELFLRYKVKN